jgi:sugar phosphate isomerase/epimerase
MQIGWCAPLADADAVKRAGLDFIEPPLAPLGLEDATAFAAAKADIARCPLPTSAFCVLFPRDMTVVGSNVDERRVKTYLGRAAELLNVGKARIIVFGSGWARNIPDDWERARGEQQYLQSLSWCADALKGSGTTLVIEPLNRKESNLVNSVAEGVRYAKLVDRPEIRVLADFYHMDEENEPLATLAEHMAWLKHIHLADTGRRNPGTGSYDYDRFFGYLKSGGYTGMICAECKLEQPETDMRFSLEFLRRYWP